MLRIHKDFEENNTVTVTVPLTEIDIDYIANRVIELLDEREKENNKETETPEESETPDNRYPEPNDPTDPVETMGE